MAKKFTRPSFLQKVPIATKLYFTVGIMAVLIAIELFTLFFAINTLSSVRAYVGGEGLWSKAQKDALYQLQRYSRTRDERDYRLFIDHMKVPFGDHRARLELQKPNPDLNIVRQGFLEGRIHPDDLDGVIKLFRRFYNISYISRAIQKWTAADSIIYTQLLPRAELLHREISAGSHSDESSEKILSEIVVINKTLTSLEDDFSYILGEGSRWLEHLILKILFGVALTVEISGLLLTFSVSRSIARGLKEIIEASKKIARGLFSARAKVNSRDEIGTLAESFNYMADDLQKQKEEQTAAEENLRKQKELYETLLNAQSEMGEGVSITDGEKFYYVNDALCNLYGYSRNELLEMKSFMQLVPEAEKKRLVVRLQQRVNGRPVGDTGEAKVQRKDGRIINIEYSVKRITEGNAARTVSIIRDVTEKVKSQQALAQQAEELKLINNELQQFAYVASHDLQEPLRTVTSYMQLIEKRYKDKLDPEGEEFIRYAVDGAARMHMLIRDLLTYSRVGTNAMPFEQVDCKAVLDTTLDNLHRSIQQNKATINIDDNLPSLKADPLQLGLLFQNLISNAIKFRSNESPVIHIKAEELETHWRFSFIDNGIGIEKEYADRVFVIFQRLHTRQQYPGSGIGLAVCKKIVERHGGKIWVEANDGEPGTTFRFTLQKSH
jgi:PAS domain S-box-containing protein